MEGLIHLLASCTERGLLRAEFGVFVCLSEMVGFS